MKKLPRVLIEPSKRPKELPSDAKWLAGEGAGSWFVIMSMTERNQYKIQRFSPVGVLECESVLKSRTDFNPDEAFEITYPSHCAEVTVIQHDEKISLKPA